MNIVSLLSYTKQMDAWFWFPIGTVLHILTFCLVTFHCLENRREAVSAVLWIFVAWSLPIIGPLLFLAFGIDRLPTKGWRKHNSNMAFLSERRAREQGAMPLAYWQAVHKTLVAEPASPFAKELNKAMNTILSEYPLLDGNIIKPMISGDEAFPQMLKAIDNAEDHIHLQTFILGNDPIGREFLDHLKNKAESGVKVRFMYDRFGSTSAFLGGLIRNYTNIPNMNVAGWTQANPIKRQFQVNLRNHRKVLIIDGKKAFLGGVNLDSENVTRGNIPPVRDYHFAMEGPIAQELQYLFLRDWYFMTDDDPEHLLSKDHFPHIPPVGKSMIRVVDSGPTREMEAVAEVFFTAIVSARKQILAVTPYLVPTQDIIRAFRSAAQRGVDVRIVVPRINNHVYAGMAGRALYDELLSSGVRIFERQPPFIHAKAMIIDDTMAIVGTANLDVRSLRLNYETNLTVYDDVFINELKRIVLEDIAYSAELDLTTWRMRPKKQRLMENFCSLLTPIL